MYKRTQPPSVVTSDDDFATVPATVSQRRRALLQGASGLLLVPLISLPARAAAIMAVRVWPAKDYTRVTMEYDVALKTTHFLVEEPDRLVVDIEGVDLNATLKELVSKITANDPYIRQVRVGQNRPKVVRMVIDLKQKIAPQVFTLAPVAEYRHRLVLDLYPTTPADPMMSLLDKDGQSVSTAQSGPDAIEQQISKSQEVHKALEHKSQEPKVRTQQQARNDQPTVNRLITIAIDPGHGGEDPGAVGRGGSYEKDVVLSVAKRIKAKLDEQPGMRAMLTRDGDYFVPLHVRVQKARRVNADLFISVHADAFMNPEARGASVFALSERGATSTAASWLAKKENDADLIGGVNVATQDKQVARVLLDLSTTAQINDSLKFGRAVLDELGGFAKLHKPRVEQAGFAVLKAPDIPSILVETAFISNPEEERKLNDERYQEQLANAIATSVKRYFAKNPPLSKSRLT